MMLRPLLNVSFAALLPLIAAAQSVTTANYDNARTNANLSETRLNPGNVGPNSFGKLFSLSVDGAIYAQPLLLAGVSVAGSVRNVVFVATMHNSVYAFDADRAGTPLWTVNLGPSIPASAFNGPNGAYTDIQPEIGILGTPVIDPATNTLYAVAGTLENGAVVYRLHALDAGSGTERFGAPAVISGQVTGVGDNSANGAVSFNPAQHIQRPGLAFAGGIVYVAFGSHGDALPYHGWLFAFSAANVQNRTAVFNATPNGSGGAFWQSGRAPAIDASGNVLMVASNGDTDGTANFSDSVLRLNPNSLDLADWFTPANFQTLSDDDDDLGSMGPLLIPNTNFLVTGGKQGVLYLLKEDNLGKLNSTDSQIAQQFQPVSWGVFNAALWNRPDGATLYLHGLNEAVQAYAFRDSSFSTQPGSKSASLFGAPSLGMAVSANGGLHGTGILWVTTPNSYPLPASGTLRAWNADDLSTELWDSGMNPADALGQFVKFANPTVANGKVYVATGSNQLAVYGLTPGQNAAPVITAVTNAASYAAGAVSPGELAAIFGENLGPASLAQGQWSPDGSLSEQVAGVAVTFNGIAAPILYASSTAVAVIVPFEVAGLGSVSIQVGVNGNLSAAATEPVAPAAPGIFAVNATGSGPGAILNSDYSVNSAANPAPAGSAVMIYATGGGLTSGQNSAARAALTAAALTQPVSVTVAGQPATVLYAGAAPGEVNGVVQVNIQLPPDVTGVLPVVLQIGAASSQGTATVNVK